MGVSVIIPYYHGNKYLENLSKVLADNIKEYEKKFDEKIEILFIMIVLGMLWKKNF